VEDIEDYVGALKAIRFLTARLLVFERVHHTAVGDRHDLSAGKLVDDKPTQLLLDRGCDFQEVDAREILDPEGTKLEFTHLLQYLYVEGEVLLFVTTDQLTENLHPLLDDTHPQVV
jgi:hypothetical protein